MNRFKKACPVPLEVKDIDYDKRVVQAYYWDSANVDSDDDLIKPGAYTKSIRDRGPGSLRPRIKHLYNHYEAIGVLKELGEDENGGWFVSKLGRDDTSRDVLLKYEDGIITEHSHGFEVVHSHGETVDGKEVRIITEGILWEVSSLDKWGAGVNTGIKSLEERNMWVKQIGTILSAIRKGKYTDDTFDLLQIQLMQIQEMVRAYDEPGVKSTLKEPDVKPTQKTAIPDYSKLIINHKNKYDGIRI